MANLEPWNFTNRFPEEFYYSRNHIWVSVDENLVTLGVTHLIPGKLGEVLYFDAPEVGDRISKETAFGTLEGVTNWATLISPVFGLIVELNEELLEQPFLLNDDSYDAGWILRAEVESEKELIDLIRAPEYKLLKI